MNLLAEQLRRLARGLTPESKDRLRMILHREAERGKLEYRMSSPEVQSVVGDRYPGLQDWCDEQGIKLSRQGSTTIFSWSEQ